MFADQVKIFFITISRRSVFWKLLLITSTVIIALISYVLHVNASANLNLLTSFFNTQEQYVLSYNFYMFLRTFFPVVMVIIICKYISDFYKNRFYINELQDRDIKLARNFAEFFGFLLLDALVVFILMTASYIFARINGLTFVWRDIGSLMRSAILLFIELIFEAVIPSMVVAKISRSMSISFVLGAIYYFLRPRLILYIRNILSVFTIMPLWGKLIISDMIVTYNGSLPFYARVTPVEGMDVKVFVASIVIRILVFVGFILVISRREENM